MILRLILAAAAVTAFSSGAIAADVGKQTGKHARKQAPECCEIYRYVYAGAWYGSEKVVAPVRRSPFGDEVQAPSGAWFPCVFSCELTIRKLHLYAWQDQGAGYVNGINPEAPRNDFWKDENGRHDYIF